MDEVELSPEKLKEMSNSLKLIPSLVSRLYEMILYAKLDSSNGARRGEFKKMVEKRLF